MAAGRRGQCLRVLNGVSGSTSRDVADAGGGQRASGRRLALHHREGRLAFARRRGAELAVPFLGTSLPTYFVASWIHQSRSLPSALFARTQTKPCIGRPVISIGVAPGRASASSSRSFPTR